MVQFENYGEHLTEWKKGLNPDDYPDIFVNKTEYPLGIFVYEIKKTQKALDFMPKFLDSHFGDNPYCSFFGYGRLVDYDDDDNRVPLSNESEVSHFFNEASKYQLFFRHGCINGCSLSGISPAYMFQDDYIFSSGIPFYSIDYLPNAHRSKENLLRVYSFDIGSKILWCKRRPDDFAFSEKYPNGQYMTTLSVDKNDNFIEKRFSEDGKQIYERRYDRNSFFMPIAK